MSGTRRYVVLRGPIRGWVIYDRQMKAAVRIPYPEGSWISWGETETGADVFARKATAARFRKILIAKNPQGA